MITILVGMQWGDEGKGKVISAIPHKWSVRMNGGPNAGHTVDGIKVHQIPPGFTNPETNLVIGAGSVVDILALQAEIPRVERECGLEIRSRLFLSHAAHVITPDHVARDVGEEETRGDHTIGTTRRGNGPVHADKYARRGYRLGDLPTTQLRGITVTDTTQLLYNHLTLGESALLLVAHGTMLDIDHGTYPYVTSSHCTAAGALVGTGLPPKILRHLFTYVHGVVKVFTTRVAPGPMRGELHNSIAGEIRIRGEEFGTTTGRPRRVGLLDLGQLEYAARINGPDLLTLTKVDVLADRDYIPIVVSPWGKPIEIDQVPGWSSTELRQTGVPRGLQRLIGMIEERTSARVANVGIGPRPHDLLDAAFPQP